MSCIPFSSAALPHNATVIRGLWADAGLPVMNNVFSITQATYGTTYAKGIFEDDAPLFHLPQTTFDSIGEHAEILLLQSCVEDGVINTRTTCLFVQPKDIAGDAGVCSACLRVANWDRSRPPPDDYEPLEYQLGCFSLFADDYVPRTTSRTTFSGPAATIPTVPRPFTAVPQEEASGMSNGTGVPSVFIPTRDAMAKAFPIPIVAGGAGGLCFIVMLLILVCWIKKRRSSGHKDVSDDTIATAATIAMQYDSNRSSHTNENDEFQRMSNASDSGPTQTTYEAFDDIADIKNDYQRAGYNM